MLHLGQYTQEDLDATARVYWRDHGFTFGDWQFRVGSGEVWAGGVCVAHLTETESETLAVIVRAWPQSVPRKGIVREMARVECYWHVDTCKVVVRRLRGKLGAGIIETVGQRGYRFVPPSAV